MKFYSFTKIFIWYKFALNIYTWSMRLFLTFNICIYSSGISCAPLYHTIQLPFSTSFFLHLETYVHLIATKRVSDTASAQFPLISTKADVMHWFSWLSNLISDRRRSVRADATKPDLELLMEMQMSSVRLSNLKLGFRGREIFVSGNPRCLFVQHGNED